MPDPDVIVIGCGAIGSAAALHLADRGARVLALDRFAPGHDRGSSHGETRAIRLAYFEHPDYVPLLQRAYTLWHHLQDRHDQKLYHETGVLGFGPAHGVLVPNVLATARQHGLAVEHLDAAAAARRWPGFRADPAHQAVFEPHAGYLRVEDAIRAQAALAAAAGAELRSGVTVHGWSAAADRIRVDTSAGTHYTQRLVITAGAWSADLLADLGVPFQVLRKHLHWFACDEPDLREDRGAPVFFFERPEGVYYGFPVADGLGLKIAEHSGGEPVTDPLQVDRTPHADDDARVQGCLADHLPGVSTTRTRHSTCLYTMTPDEHFVVGQHPGEPRVALVAGLSGHGFKFAPVLGEVLADLTLEGRTALPIDFLSPLRFQPAAPGTSR